MDLVVSIISSAVIETGKSLGCYYPTIKNFISFKSNLSALEKEINSLHDLRNKVIEDVDSSEAQMTQWLREVEQIMLEVDSVQAGMTTNNQKLCGCFIGCSKRSRLSKEVARMLKEVEILVTEGNIAYKMVCRSHLAKAVEQIPGPCIENQTTASKILATVMDLLNDDDVKRIGVWGMGGVGKTTLAKNLNNKLKDSSTTSTQPFDIVIWATVSKKLDLREVQIQIAERLNLDVKMADSVQKLAIRLHQRLLKERFLLILDDVWETIDLDSLGVPQPEIHTGSKIILMSRSLEVCRSMKVDKEVKVDVLNDEESWQLFCTNAGKVATLERIEPIARAVSRECSGLPLAIITVGTAMREKTMIELWKDALNELQRSIPYIKGIENTLYKPLKWSYDLLQGKNIKPCFLYCCLYPEDFSIEVSELEKCWVGEGLIDQQQNYENSYNRGIALIENLKDSCLLEHGAHEGTVKIHDVVRDVAIWISHCLEDECKSLVRSGIGLTRISEAEMLQSLKRISFTHNKLIDLPDSDICCPKTVCLLLQGNLTLKRMPDGFLRAFKVLKVLNLSRTLIQSLPKSILELVDLQVLLLRGCAYLEELPPLGKLRKLQVLDCCETGIRELPIGMKSLSNLRQLYLSRTYKLRTIHGGIISSLFNLEVLDMTVSAYGWNFRTFTELLRLQNLLVLSIRLEDILGLGSIQQTWIGRLRRYQFVICPHQTTFWQSELDGRRLTIVELDVAGLTINYPLLTNTINHPLLTNATSLVLDRCGLKGIFAKIWIERTHCFSGLKSVTIANSELWGSSSSNYNSKSDLLPNLEELHLLHVEGLESISELVDSLGLRLSRLQIIEAANCPRLTYLLRYDNSNLNTKMLELIKFNFCHNLCEFFRHSPGEIKAPGSPVPNLRRIKVKTCNSLGKLPLRDLNPNTIEEIRGDEVWWTKLEQGSDEDTKIHLQHVFKPVKLDWTTTAYATYITLSRARRQHNEKRAAGVTETSEEEENLKNNKDNSCEVTLDLQKLMRRAV